MTPIYVIILLLIPQIIGYILLDRNDLKKWKYLILIIILGLNFLVFPSYFIPENQNYEPRCGMPALANTLSFWIIGGGLTILTHVMYVFIKKYLTSKK